MKEARNVIIVGILLAMMVAIDFATAKITIIKGEVVSTHDYPNYQIVSIDTNKDKMFDMIERFSYKFRGRDKMISGNIVEIRMYDGILIHEIILF